MYFDDIHTPLQVLQDPSPSLTHPTSCPLIFVPESIESNLYIPNSLECGATAWCAVDLHRAHP